MNLYERIAAARRERTAITLSPGDLILLDEVAGEQLEHERKRSGRRPYYLNEYETSRRHTVDGTPDGLIYEIGLYVQCHGTFATYDGARSRVDAMQTYIAERQCGLGHAPRRRSGSGRAWPIIHVERTPGEDFSTAPAQDQGRDAPRAGGSRPIAPPARPARP